MQLIASGIDRSALGVCIGLQLDMIDRAIQFFEAGGWVMYPLLLLSVIGLGIVIERGLFWGRYSTKRELSAFRKYADLLESGDRDALIAVSDTDRSPIGKLVYWGSTRRSPSEESVLATIELIRPSLEVRNGLLSVIVGAAPLLGILGTVVGIIESFDLLGQASSVSDPAIVGGRNCRSALHDRCWLDHRVARIVSVCVFQISRRILR